MKYTCIAADLDGTLLDSNKRLSEKTERILGALAAAGIPFIPATGRPVFAIPQQVLALPGVRYAVVSNGVAVYDVAARKPVYAKYLPADFVPQLLEVMDGEDVEYECMYAGRAYIASAVYNKLEQLHPNPAAAQYFHDTRTPLENLEAFMRAHAQALEAVDLRLNPCRRELLRAKIESACPPVYITASEPGRLEISCAGSGKHRGVEKACTLLGVSTAGLVTFGDNDNDLEMLLHAALGVAVENATPACRDAAGRICPSNDEDGVAQALAALFADLL